MMIRMKWMLVVSALFAVVMGMTPAGAQQVGSINASLLEDDFSDTPIGGVPYGWVEVKQDHGAIHVVEDDGLDSNQALEVYSRPVDGRAGQVRLEKHLSAEAADATVIAIDFKLKWKSGVFNGYIRDVEREEYVVDWAWGLDDGVFRVRNKNVAVLEDGEWASIRLVADRESGKVTVYVDDMNEAAGTDINFRTKTDAWSDMVLRFATSPKDEAHQSFIGDVNVWIVQ